MYTATTPLRAAIGAALLLAAIPAAQAYTIDSSISDWGITPTGHASDWTPSSSVKAWLAEDQTGSSGTFLNPGYGGQAYDAEAIYLDWDSNYLYVLVLTGLSPNVALNPAANIYGAGDIAIDFGRNGSFDYAMVVKNYAGLTPGTVYSASTWNYGLWSGPGQLANGSHPATNVVALKTGTAAGVGVLSYTSTAITNLGAYASDSHYAIEAAIPISALGANWGANGPTLPFDVQWTMYCANDVILVDPVAARVPEPSAPIVLSALAAFAAWRIRRRA